MTTSPHPSETWLKGELRNAGTQRRQGFALKKSCVCVYGRMHVGMHMGVLVDMGGSRECCQVLKTSKNQKKAISSREKILVFFPINLLVKYNHLI